MNFADDDGPARDAAPARAPAPRRRSARDRAGRRAPARGRAPRVPRRLADPLVPAARGRRQARADAFEAPFYLNGMARGALPHDHRGLFSRSRKFALAQADCVFVFGTPFDFRVDYGRTPTWAADGEDRPGRPRRRRARAQPARRRRHRRRQRPRARAAPRGRGHEEGGDVARRRARRRGQAPREDARRDRVERLAAQPAARLRRARQAPEARTTSSSGDGGDFVATAAYVLKLEWPQLWMDPGPLGTLGVGPGYAMAAQARAARRARRARLRRRQLRAPRDGVRGDGPAEDPRRRRHRQRRRRGRRSAAARSRSTASSARSRRGSTTRATRRSSRRAGAAGFWVEKVEQLGPALDEAFACGVPACVNVKIAKSDFRKGAISV